MDDAREHLLEELGRAVRERRNERGLTLRELSEKAGVSTRFLADLEAGRGNISVLRLHDVAVALGTTASALLDAEARRAKRGPRTIALLGLRGAGKSTIGPRLAEALGVPFVELDDRIEEAAGLSLTELFALHGEGYYRRLETQCLSALIALGRPFVVALSGGVVQNEEAFRLARAHCTTVWLRARPEDHMQRVLAQGDRRPIAGRADAMAELQAILAAREPQYRQADVTVDTSHHGPGTLEALLRALERAGWSRPPS